MDPITPLAALALVCNITQLVGQAIDGVRCCKELWNQGSLDKHNLVEACSEHIIEANDALILATTPRPSSGRTSRIETLAKEAVATAKELRVELNKLKLSKAQGVKTAHNFRRALATFVKGGAIRRIEEKLDRQERALKSSLLKDLYIKCGRIDLVRRDEFKTLSQGQIDIITQVLQSRDLLSADIATSIKSSETNITSHMDKQDVQLTENLRLLSLLPDTIEQSDGNVVRRLNAQDACLQQAAGHNEVSAKRWQRGQQYALRRRLLDALAFPEINERRNMVEKQVADFGSTCAWIVKHCDSIATHSWSEIDNRRISSSLVDTYSFDFAAWLLYSEDVFWISGKPGSGKSSLMNFIYHYLESGRLGSKTVQAGSISIPVKLLSFWFFRPTEVNLLHSLQGIWRSLCFQILDSDESLYSTVCDNDDGSAPSSLRSALSDSGSLARSWTDSELRLWLLYLTKHSKFKFCILIDGLDELKDGQSLLLETIELLASDAVNAKILCSSRPETLFESRLAREYHSIPLQDVNYQDIKSDCQRRLEGTRAARFAIDIAWRAEGVFLWAHIVAEDLRLASEHGDDDADLSLRLDRCPTGMNQLFEHLLQRQDKFYVRGTKPCLRLIEFDISKYGMATLFDVFIASRPQEDFSTIMSRQKWDAYVSTIDADAATFATNVVARCAGLVEVYPLPARHNSFSSEKFPYANLRRLDSMRARFIHRSALDYLLERSGETSSLLPNPATGAYPEMLLMYAEKISQAGWTSRETTLMDIWFLELSTYLPRSGLLQFNTMWSPSGKVWAPHWPEVRIPEITSPDLTRQENLSFGVTAFFKLEAYNNDKARDLTTDRLMIILIMMYCNATRNKTNCLLETYSPFLDQPLQSMLSIRLDYDLMASVPAISSTCYIWEHLEIARVAEYFRNGFLETETRGRSAPRLLMEAVEEKQTLCTHGLAIGHQGDLRSLLIVPLPDDWCDEKVQEWDLDLFVFKYKFVLRASQLGLRNQYHEPLFLRWKMAGTTRLMDLSEEQSHALYAATGELDVNFGIEDWYIDNVVVAWNILLPEVPPQETAQILDSHRLSGLSLVFEDGEVLIAEDEDHWEWRQDLVRDRNEETDPVLVEYLKITTMSWLEGFAKAQERCAAERHGHCPD